MNIQKSLQQNNLTRRTHNTEYLELFKYYSYQQKYIMTEFLLIINSKLSQHKNYSPIPYPPTRCN